MSFAKQGKWGFNKPDGGSNTAEQPSAAAQQTHGGLPEDVLLQ